MIAKILTDGEAAALRNSVSPRAQADDTAALEKMKRDKRPLSRATFMRVFTELIPRIRAALDERGAKMEARNAELQALIDKAAVTIESLERRASRHADHLGKLESRLQSLEKK